MAKNTRPRALAAARTAADSYEQLQRQNAQMGAYIHAQGWDLVAYCEDRSVPGTIRPFDRPGLGPWLKRPDKMDILLTATSLALSRGSDENAEEILAWAGEHGIEIWTVAEGNLAEVAPTLLSRTFRRPVRRL